MASIFTQIIQGTIPATIVLNQERWLAFFDVHPVSFGHLLLVPRQEVALLTELDGASLAETGAWLARLDRALRTATNCAGLSILLRDGSAAGQEVPHLHWHLIPRYPGDPAHDFSGKQAASQEDLGKLHKKLLEALA